MPGPDTGLEQLEAHQGPRVSLRGAGDTAASLSLSAH